jgi:hypothetical protein
MTTMFDTADVPEVSITDLYQPMRMLIANGNGLALLRGLSEDDLRDLEHAFWAGFSGTSETRLAVALRFRALVDVFASRRLKELHLQRGFKTLALAIREAATQRLNTRYGFKPQAFVAALGREPRSIAVAYAEDIRLAA